MLFLAHRVPYPPDKGDKIRAFHLLAGLVESGHEVHLLAFADVAHDLRHEAALNERCASARLVPLDRRRAGARALFGVVHRRRPLSVAYFDSPAMHEAVRTRLSKLVFDAAFVSSSSMVQYVPGGLVERSVVDLVDADSEKWLDYARRVRGPAGWIYALEARRLRRYEQAIVRSAAYTVLTTEREARLLRAVDQGSQTTRLRAINNGVDLAYFSPGAHTAELPLRERRFFRSDSVPRLLFTGAMDYAANVDGVRYFVDQVWPLILRQRPGAEFLIVGPNPVRSIRRLAARPGVTVTGYVQDVRPYLASATVCLAPLRIARGVQNKVLEAMASGRAVVASPQAVAGLGVVHGEHLLVAAMPQAMAEAVLAAINDAGLRHRLGRQARLYVEAEHRWAPAIRRLAGLLESAAAAA